MKNNKAVYVTCTQIFAMQNGLKKLIQEEHIELWWNYCGKMFRNKKEVVSHISEACKSTCYEWTSKYEVKNYKRRHSCFEGRINHEEGDGK